MCEEMAEAMQSQKNGKAAWIDNIPAELTKHGGDLMTDVLTRICNKIWQTGVWSVTWTGPYNHSAQERELATVPQLPNHKNTSQIKDQASAHDGPLYLPVCVWDLDSDSRPPEKGQSLGSEIVEKNPWHPLHHLCYQWGCLHHHCPACESLWRSADHHEEKKVEMVWICNQLKWTV